MNKTQRARTQSLFRGNNDVAAFRQTVSKERNPESLHQIACLCNETGIWHDMGFEWPQSIADHAHCDAGTALMLYWMETPEYVYETGLCDDSTEDEIGHLEYIKSIESNLFHQLYRSSRIKFDPRKALSNKKNVQKYQWIPCGMFIPTPGKIVKPLKWTRDREYKIELR